MSYLYESPYLILTIGVFFLAILGYLFVNTRQKGALIGMGVVVALTLICLAIEHFVETPREQVEASIEGLADALEDNNIEDTLEYLDSNAEVTREKARWAMGRFHVIRAKVSNLRIEINELTSPPSATVKFTGTIRATDKKGQYETQVVPVTFTAKLRQHGDRWVVTEHTDNVGIH